MKFLAVVLICCGIALAVDYDGEKECDLAANKIDKVVEGTKIQAADLMLWALFKAGKIFIDFDDWLEENPTLNTDIVTEQEKKIQYSQTVEHILSCLADYQQASESDKSSIVLSADEFHAFEADIAVTEIATEYFVASIESASPTNAVSTNDKEEIIKQARALHLLLNSALARFYASSLEYETQPIKSFKKFDLMLVDALGKLNASSFGRTINPFVKKYSYLRSTIESLIKKAADETLNEKSRELVRFALFKIYYIYGFDNAYAVISYVTSYLDAFDVEDLAATEISALNETCTLLESNLHDLEQLVANISQDLQANRPYQSALIHFLDGALPLESFRFILAKQLIGVLEALPIPKTTELQRQFDAIKLPSKALGLEKGPAYNIRHDYGQMIERIDKAILQNWEHPVFLVRWMWQHLAQELLKALNREQLQHPVKEFLSEIVLTLQLQGIANYLAGIPTTYDHDFAINLNTLDYFEQKVTAFIQLIQHVGDPKFGATNAKISNSAQNVFSSIQLVLYQLKVIFAIDINDDLDASAKGFDGMNGRFESGPHLGVRSTIKPLIVTIQAIAPTFSSLVNNHILLSAKPTENRAKIAFARCIIDQINGAHNIVFLNTAFSYFASVLDQTKEDPNLGEINQASIQQTCSTINSHLSELKVATDFVDEMCVENAPAPNLFKLENIAKSIWTMNADHFTMGKQIAQIFMALPSPPQDNTELYKSYKYIEKELAANSQ